jgi:hypothetical protein
MENTEVHHAVYHGYSSGIDWKSYETFLTQYYARTTVLTVWCYSRKYQSFWNDVSGMDHLTKTTRNNVIKSLLILSRFLGKYEDFKYKLKQNNIKLVSNDNGLKAFNRILNAQNSDVLQWIKTIEPNLRENEKLFVKFLLSTGMREGEAISSFNKIRVFSARASHKGILADYYNADLSCLQHFKFESEFVRRTKSVYISFIDRTLIDQIANLSISEQLTYSRIRKRLLRSGITKPRFNEVRDFYGTYMLHHELLQEEVNLLQGRIPASVFIKHY